MAQPNGHGKPTTIVIDGNEYRVRGVRITGQELVDLLTPPAGTIWIDVDNGPDVQVAADESIEIVDKMTFFTDRPVTIVLDRATYSVAREVTEVDLRALPTSPIGANREIWRDLEETQDEALAPGQSIAVKGGDRFYSVPSRINPGAAEGRK